MARTDTQIKEELDALEKLLSSGAKKITIDGVSTDYRETGEINARIFQLKQELDTRNGQVVKTIFTNVNFGHSGDL